MTIKIPDSLLLHTGLSQEGILLRIALILFAEEKLTLGQASQLAGLHQMLFQKELAKRKIPIHYGIEEFEADMKTIKKLGEHDRSK